ncbi:MAG TPA: hypothetical protein VF403_11130 [Kofleriaceae bacterium]
MRDLISIAVLASCAPAPVPAAPSQTVGVRTFDAVDPVGHAAMPMAVFYPAIGSAARAQFGPYDVAAGKDLPVRAGSFPLVVISHGHSGSQWGHHDLAEALAAHGYVVATLEHPGDNYRDQSGFRSDRVLFGRAYQVSAAIDAVLADPTLHVDPKRIGVAGFSAGGWTSLLVAGAQPDLGQIESYCTLHRDDVEICGGPLRHELESVKPTADHRVRAAFVMAPFAVAFAPDAFRDVTAPVFLAWGAADQVLLPDENARAIRPRLATLRGTREIPAAGHYVFLAPCPPAFANELVAICKDPPGVDRAAVHRELAGDAIAFFDASL